MVKRLLKTTKNSSFFIFGARGTGKSTYVQEQFKSNNPWYLNLLDPEVEDYYARQPKRIENELKMLKKKPDWIIIDEIQKVPRLLDMVHLLIEKYDAKFVLTGSSARKLKRGGANFLAGRAFVYELFPLTSIELGDRFELLDVLHWGSLPRALSLNSAKDRSAYLKSYVLTYLNEEIKLEQIVRRLDPFRSFLEIAGQVSGRIINHKKIADEVGVDSKTIQSYFQILEETLVGFYLPAFHSSVRKSQRLNPKFYLFDTGVKKALENSLDQRPAEQTATFGELFESFLINEIRCLNSYDDKNFKLSYFSTKSGVEVDLVLSKGRQHYLIEIKSSTTIDEREVNSLSRLVKDFPQLKKAYYVSRCEKPQKIGDISCIHWQKFLLEFRNL